MSTFWLDMAVRHDAKLTDIDRFLRRTWLECCGHMSEFSTGAQRKVTMRTRLSEALGFGDRFGDVYDFGSSTDLVVRLLGDVSAFSTGAVRLAARNEAPTWPCDGCGEAATAVCTQCLYKVRGSFAPRMHQITIVVRRCCCRWSIHHGWASVRTPVRPNSNWSRRVPDITRS